MMHLREKIEHVRKRPELYGLRTFGEFVAFVNGIDFARTEGFLSDFSDWLSSKSNLGANISWYVLIVRMAYPDRPANYWLEALRSESVEAVTVLFDELQSFMVDREM